jgi:hypothetical protein
MGQKPQNWFNCEKLLKRFVVGFCQVLLSCRALTKW